MNEISVRNFLRLYSGPIVSVAILLILASAGVAAFFEAWWIVGLLGIAAIVVPVFFYRDLRYWVQFHRGVQAFRNKSYVEAEGNLREALCLAELFAPDDLRRGSALIWLVQAARAQGNIDDAEAFGLQGVTTAERACGSEHAFTMHAMLLLASVYVSIAQYAKAEPLLQKVLVTLEGKRKPARAQLAECLVLLGRVSSEQGRDAAAEPFYRRAYEIAASGRERIARTLELAQLCARRKNVAEAETLLQHALAELPQTGEPESILMANFLEMQAFVQMLQGRLTEAEALQRQSLVLIEKLAGPNMPASSSGLNQLGEILTAQGKLADAEPCLRAALRLRQEYMAPEHPALADVLENLAELLLSMGRCQEAEGCLGRAEQIRAVHASHDHE